MKQEQKEYAARSVEVYKCPDCHGLHIRLKLNDIMAAVGVMDPDQWADIFMADPEFRREAAARLKAIGA